MGRWLVPYLANPAFWIVVLAAFYTNHLQNSSVINLWTSYGMDLLAMPVYLYIAQVAMMIYYRSQAFRISHKDRFIILIVISTTFELALPLYSDRYTADWIDVIAYIIGTYAFYPLILNTPNFLLWLTVYLKKRL